MGGLSPSADLRNVNHRPVSAWTSIDGPSLDTCLAAYNETSLIALTRDELEPEGTGIDIPSFGSGI